MSARVFISYANPDKKHAQQMHHALTGRGISCWFAPEDLRSGDEFPAEIVDAISGAAVFLLLWSKSAAKSRHVMREIGLADTERLKFFPVRIGDAPLEASSGYYLKSLHVPQFGKDTPQRLTNEIDEHLRVAGAPYPVRNLYQQVSSRDLDLEGHIEGVRLTTRLTALVHVAKYAQRKSRDAGLTRSIERLLDLESLFSDFDIARQLHSWLDNRGDCVHSGFRELFRFPTEPLPTAADFDNDDLSAARFDRKNVHALCGVEDFLAQSDARGTGAERNLSSAIEKFVRKAIALAWTELPFWQ